MEYCRQGALYDVLRYKDHNILPPQVVGWSRQIANSKQFLHSHRIIHRDLSSNVLVSDTDQLKISDFGMSRAFGDKCTWVRFASTVAWMALGMIQEESCSEKVDIRLHLDIAAQEFIKINPAVYLESQNSWQQEVKEKFKCARAECAELHLKEADLIEKREKELQSSG